MTSPITRLKALKNAQAKNVGLIIVVVTSLLGLLYLMMDNEPTKNTEKQQELPTAFDSTIKKINTESHFQEKTESRILAMQKMAEDAKKKVDSAEESQKAAMTEDRQRIDALIQKVSELEKQLAEKTPTPGLENQSVPAANPAEQMPPNQHGEFSKDDSIQEDTIELVTQENDGLPEKNPATYVPSGTFVAAVMLGGADASTAVTSQSNPSPMLFRIVDHGILPNGAQSNLKDCMITAAVSGDISSERGKVRLETLSCTRSNGGIIDIPVKGTIFGSDGKNGVRGKPLWREGALLQRALFAGTLSGFSNALSQRYTTTSISPLGSTQTVRNDAIWSYGAARGAGSAMEKLAEYNIKRAEQYHPVIQLSAGSEVDIVFLEGFYLDGRRRDGSESNQTTKNVSTITPTAASPDQNAPSPLPLTEAQINRLRERQKELGSTRPRNVNNE